MAKFKDSGKNLKFSDIVDHFTSHVSQDPIEHKISEYYKGGRYIAEKKNQYHIYPDTTVLNLQDYPFSILLITSNAVPQLGDKLRLFDASGNPLSLNDCPIIGQIWPYQQQDIQNNLPVQYPKYSAMSAELKEIFNGAYFISFSNQSIGTVNSTSNFKLNDGDKTGVVTEWADRLGRARAVVVRATGAYTDGVNNDNPSNIPVDISDDDEGTEIKFSDFYGGYAKVDLDERETSKTTSRTTNIGKTIEFSTNYTTSWQTATLVQSTFERQTSRDEQKFAGYRQTRRTTSYSQQISVAPYQAQTLYFPGGQETRQFGGGFGSPGYPGQVTVQPVYKSTYKPGFSYIQQKSRQTSWQTNNPPAQVQTSWTTSFNLEVVAQTTTTRQTTKQTSSSFNSSWQTSWSTEFDTTFSFWN